MKLASSFPYMVMMLRTPLRNQSQPAIIRAFQETPCRNVTAAIQHVLLVDEKLYRKMLTSLRANLCLQKWYKKAQ